MRQKMDLTTGQKLQCNNVEEAEVKNSTQRVSTGYSIIILAQDLVKSKTSEKSWKCLTPAPHTLSTSDPRFIRKNPHEGPKNRAGWGSGNNANDSSAGGGPVDGQIYRWRD